MPSFVDESTHDGLPIFKCNKPKLPISGHLNMYSENQQFRQNMNSLRNPPRKVSPSAFSDIIRPTFERTFRVPHRKSNSIISTPRDLTSSSHRNTRRKLSSVSKRNSRHKIADGEKWSSDDSDVSVDTSRFGNYLSNLSACPSLENGNIKTTHRKLRKGLPKDTKSPREKCYDFLNTNFSSTNFFSKNARGKDDPRIFMDFNSSSSDLGNSEHGQPRRVYSDDSLDESENNISAKLTRNRCIVSGDAYAPQFVNQAASNCGMSKHPVVLNEELEILKRQLFLKELELQESLKTSEKSSPGYTKISAINSAQHSRTVGCYEDSLKSPSIRSNETYDVINESFFSPDGTFNQYQDHSFPKCNHPPKFLSPEPQILSEKNSIISTGSNKMHIHRNYNTKNKFDFNRSSQLQLTNKTNYENCSCSTNSMSQPVQSMLKYFHPAKYSSPHSSFSNSRCSLASDSTNIEQKRLSRLSLTSQFWSKKQLNRDRGVTYTGFWNTTRNIGAFNRFNTPRMTPSPRESSHGATPFGCTGFFIPATKMKSIRRKSDPFVNNCSKKTMDLMRSMQIPSSPGSQLSYQYLSRMMKLDNDLKIIPERLPIFSKKTRNIQNA